MKIENAIDSFPPVTFLWRIRGQDSRLLCRLREAGFQSDHHSITVAATKYLTLSYRKLINVPAGTPPQEGQNSSTSHDLSTTHQLQVGALQWKGLLTEMTVTR